MIEKLFGTSLKFNLELISKITFVGKKNFLIELVKKYQIDEKRKNI